MKSNNIKKPMVYSATEKEKKSIKRKAKKLKMSMSQLIIKAVEQYEKE